MAESPNYIVVQAGGRGSRMELLTRNKPKALVPIENRPMLFHLFQKFPAAHFILIGDYKCDVLERYLAAFAGDVSYEIVRATGGKGTCAGLRAAFERVPAGERFLLIWCDLILAKDWLLPTGDADYVGIADGFSCRWRFADGRFSETASRDHGVTGAFLFQDKTLLADVPLAGEFVAYLDELAARGHAFRPMKLMGAREYGHYSDWEKLPRMKWRPFNRLEVRGDRVYKMGIDAQGLALGKRESNWYRQIAQAPFKNLPHVYEYEPLVMEWIDGKNIYEYTYLPQDRKRQILEEIIGCLRALHALGSVEADVESYREAYLGKTYARLAKVRALVPFADAETVVINGRRCRNIFFPQEAVDRLVMQYVPDAFVFLHGDPTFSNMMLRHDTEPVLIDPRGYFGTTEIYGDAAYDWVKLYYSLVSNYDQFNLKRFALDIRADGVTLQVASSNWEDMEDAFFELLAGDVTRAQMKLLLALTWLSLTTYAWEDYDSICGAFYQGVYLLEEALAMEEEK